MGKVLHGRVAKTAAVAALVAIAVIALFFASPPKANTALPVKPVVEISPVETAPPGTETVEMFVAVGRGDLAVRLVPEKDQQARVELENRTDRPLTVQVPQAFGGRFILAGVAPPARGGRNHSGLARQPGLAHAAAACFAFRRKRSDAFASRLHVLTSRSPSRAPAWSTKCVALRN